MKITLLHPSRGRAALALIAHDFWADACSKSKHEVEHILSIDASDEQTGMYVDLFKKYASTKVIINDNTNVVEATNEAAKIATGDVLIYLSDDFRCPESWDLLIEDILSVEKYKLTEMPTLIKVDDCLQKFEVPVLTIPIMNKALYKRLGYFWHPGYKSMFVDEDLYWTCKNNGWLLEAPDLKFPHEHCSIGKAERDETYIRSEQNWNQGKALFAERKSLNFPLTCS